MKHQINYSIVMILFFITSTISGRALELEGSCSCAAIQDDGLEPILQQTLQFNISCNEEGADECERLCTALAIAAKDKGPEAICGKLKGHVENLQINLYTKICNGNSWKFSGIRLPNPICCHEGRATLCPSSE
ncbi:uncharacterized protein [Chelonus insularis]|uniref:uncharacterized protein n=1 Tax=Chelonus insularis TaxID=460826 RepID=UPI00158E4756|nr:uncharacterized protein LOC118071939 [Chelonus insularis]